MAVLTREELMEQVKAHIGDATDDNALKFIEDVSDTLADLETKANSDTEDWKQKYEDNDKMWRDKYKERFFSGSSDEGDNGVSGSKHEDDLDDKAPKTFEDLFK